MLRIYIFCVIIVLSCSGKERPAEKKTTGVADPNKTVVCFVYHRFGDSRYPTTNVSVRDFEAHLTYLKQRGFQVLSFSEAIQYLHSEEPVKKTAVITIDDGYKSFFKNGFPLLKKYDMPATLFINTKSVGNTDFMDWQQLKIVMKNKVEIGNHTHSHDYFLNENATTRYKKFKAEIEQSQSLISEALGVTPEIFSYPYGEFDTQMKDIVKESGFKAAAAQNSGVLYGGTDVYQVPRFPMAEAYAGKTQFAEKALMKPLKIISESPDNFIMPPNNQPLLTLTIDPTDLKLDQLQCFVQGGACTLRVIDKTKATVTLQAVKPITKRRRTLYTLTVPDNKGVWHWYSHLWITPAIKIQE